MKVQSGNLVEIKSTEDKSLLHVKVVRALCVKTIKIPLTIKLLFIGLWQPWSLTTRREPKSLSHLRDTHCYGYLEHMASPACTASWCKPVQVLLNSTGQRFFRRKKREQRGQRESGTFSDPADVIGKACNIVKLSKKRLTPDTALATSTRNVPPTLAFPLAVNIVINNSVLWVLLLVFETVRSEPDIPSNLKI